MGYPLGAKYDKNAPYNEKTKTIELKCDSKYSKTKIKILKSTDDILILDFEFNNFFKEFIF
jgi:hypothetical protein